MIVSNVLHSGHKDQSGRRHSSGEPSINGQNNPSDDISGTEVLSLSNDSPVPLRELYLFSYPNQFSKRSSQGKALFTGLPKVSSFEVTMGMSRQRDAVVDGQFFDDTSGFHTPAHPARIPVSSSPASSLAVKQGPGPRRSPTIDYTSSATSSKRSSTPWSPLQLRRPPF